MTGQSTIWLRIHDCLSVTIDGSKRTNDITSLHSQYHYGLTDRRPTTSRLNWPISSITRVQYHQLTTAEVIEASVTVNNSPTQDYVHPDDHAQPTYEITPGFKPFTVYLEKIGKIIYVFLKSLITVGNVAESSSSPSSSNSSSSSSLPSSLLWSSAVESRLTFWRILSSSHLNLLGVYSRNDKLLSQLQPQGIGFIHTVKQRNSPGCGH